MGKIYIIGIGSKARQGKDTIANFIKEMRNNVYIIHWADDLYEEVRNASNNVVLDFKYPLVVQHYDLYFLLNNPTIGQYLCFSRKEVPYLHDIFFKRKISVYDSMKEKDSEMLQFWGTNFRRKMNSNYWVERTGLKIQNIINTHLMSPLKDEDLYICIADTRFQNEYEYIKHCTTDNFKLFNKNTKHLFVKVVRALPQTGKQYIDAGRDSEHPSECELDDIIPDYYIRANDGDLAELEKETKKFIDSITS